MALISLTRIFAALTTSLPSYLDDNFTTIVNLLNGNLDEANVSRAADSIKAGGFDVSQTPAANKILPLGSDSKFPWLSIPALRGAKATKSGTQSINNATGTTVAFDTESYDTDTIHDNVTNNSRLTIPSGITKAAFTAQIEWAANTVGYRRLELLDNGSVVQTIYSSPTPSGGYSMVQLSTGVISVIAGHYYELQVYQTSGGALNINQASTFFSVELYA